MLHDRAEAEDAIQEAALKSWRHRSRLRCAADFRPWFLGIVANQCRTVRRGRWWTLIRLPEIERYPRTWSSGGLLADDVATASCGPHHPHAAVPAALNPAARCADNSARNIWPDSMVDFVVPLPKLPHLHDPSESVQLG